LDATYYYTRILSGLHQSTTTHSNNSRSPAFNNPRYAIMAVILSFLLAIFGLFHVSNAHTVLLRAHSRECFFEDLHTDDQMTVTYQVSDRESGPVGNLHIDFWVCAYDS
jgi:hypothetical protein